MQKMPRAKGGPRKGAGFATDTGGAKTERHSVTLDAATVERLKELGAGNLSRGIREAARRVAANAPHEGRTAALSPGVPLDAVVGPHTQEK